MKTKNSMFEKGNFIATYDFGGNMRFYHEVINPELAHKNYIAYKSIIESKNKKDVMYLVRIKDGEIVEYDFFIEL